MDGQRPGNQPVLATPRQRLFASWAIFLLVDIVVLNIWVEFSDSVIIDSFIISIFAAILMRALLEVTLRLEHRVTALFAAHPGALSKALRILSAWLILFLSKFVILEIIDIIFGDDVELGGLITFILLVVTLVATEELIKFIYQRLGESEQGRLVGSKMQ